MRINHNIAALNTYRQLNSASNAQSKSMEKLSSGLRINRAGDDAAGLAISEKMRGQIRGLDMASRNAQDGISMIQTAEGALNETHDILQRMRELATQAANDTNTDTDRGEIQKEINQLTSEINRIGNTTEFNTKKLLKGGSEPTGQVGSVTNTAGVAAGGTDATAELVAKGLTITGAGDGTDYNGYTVTIADNNTEGIAVDHNAKTITISLDLQGTPNNDISLFVPTVTGTAPAGGEFTFSGNASGLTTADVGSLGTTAGGSAASSGTAGSTDFTITTALAANDTIEVAGEKITVYATDADLAAANNGTGDNFGISLEQASTAADQAAAIRAMTFADRTVTGTGAQVVITQDTAGTGDVTGPKLGNTKEDFGASFQIGANAGQSMTIDVRDMRATSDALKVASEDGTTVQSKSGKTAKYTTATNVTNGTDNQGTFKALDVSTHENASAAIDVINDAIEEVSAERSKLGAFQNRLEHTINNLGTSSENLTAAESRVRDVDMAKEMMNQTKNSILSQAAQAMLAQANQQPQGVLQLLR